MAKLANSAPVKDEATNVGEEIHAQWPFISAEEARDYYYTLGHINISEGTVKTALWVLKKVLDHEKRRRMIDAHPACWLEYGGRHYVPAKGPSAYMVGTGTWFDDEQSLSVRHGSDYPESILVGAEDVQIMFPPFERWVVADRYRRLMSLP